MSEPIRRDCEFIESFPPGVEISLVKFWDQVYCVRMDPDDSVHIRELPEGSWQEISEAVVYPGRLGHPEVDLRDE